MASAGKSISIIIIIKKWYNKSIMATSKKKSSKQTKSKSSDVVGTIQRFASLIGACGVICAFIAGAGTWMVNQINGTTNERIDAIEARMDENHSKTNLQIVRLELMSLIDLDPDNVVEISKVARHYFIDLHGDQFMTGIVSKWCTEHNIECSDIVLE